MITSERLKDAIEKAGLRQKEVAAAAGISESCLSNILSGRRVPRLKTAEAILSVLRERTGRRRGLTLNDLVGGGRAA